MKFNRADMMTKMSQSRSMETIGKLQLLLILSPLMDGGRNIDCWGGSDVKFHRPYFFIFQNSNKGNGYKIQSKINHWLQYILLQ